MKGKQESREVRSMRRTLAKMQKELDAMVRNSQRSAEQALKHKKVLEDRLEACSKTLRASLTNFSRPFYQTKNKIRD